METLYMIGSGAAVVLLVAHIANLLLRRPTRGSDDQRQLADAFEKHQREVWSELQALRTEHLASLEDLHERMDFAERLLTQGQQHTDAEKQPATPT